MTWTPLKRWCRDSGQYGLNIAATEYTTTGTRLIRTSDIEEDGTLKDFGAVYVDPEEVGTVHSLKPGDLLFSRSGSLGKCLEYTSEMPSATFAGYLVRFRPTTRENSRYMSYVAQSAFFQQRIEAEAVSSTIANFNAQRYALLQLPWWESSRQQAIADHLDRETARIDGLIAKKRSLMDLLEERQTNFVSRTVTAGFGMEPLVDTGNRYAPQIPATWRLMRLRHVITDLIDTPHSTAPYVDDGEYLVVRTSNVKNGRLDFNDARYTDYQSWVEWNRRGEPRPGDVMLTREAPAGEACIVPEKTPLCIGQRMVLVRANGAVMSGEWLLHSIYSGTAQRFITDMSNATTVPHINMSDIPDIPIALPPREEQDILVAAINKVVHHAEETNKRLDRQVLLLTEHRQALITAAVTGELLVPEVAA